MPTQQTQSKNKITVNSNNIEIKPTGLVPKQISHSRLNSAKEIIEKTTITPRPKVADVSRDEQPKVTAV